MTIRRTLAAALLGGLLAATMPSVDAGAQTAGKAAPPAGAKNLEGGKIKATIVNISKLDKGFSIQILLQNLRSNTIYVALMTSNNIAMSSSGHQFELNERHVLGVTPCFAGVKSAEENCKSLAPDEMTAIEPSQSAILGITYERGDDPGVYVSFGLKFMVRDALPARNALTGSGSPAAAGPPSAVTISFPTIPFTSPS